MIIINALKKSKYMAFFIGIFAFIIGYFFIPSNNSYDIYGHYRNFEALSSESIKLLYSKDYYLRYLFLFLKKWNIAPNFAGAISCFLLYYFLTKSFMILKKYEKLNAANIVFWLAVIILSIPLISFSGLRYYTALIFYIFGVIKLIYERKKIGVLFLMISPLIHFGVGILTVITLIYLLILEKISIRSLKILVFICFIIGNLNLIEILKNIIEIINSFGIVYFNTYSYIDGKWGMNYGTDQNIIGRLVDGIRFNLRKIIMLYYSFIKIKINSEKLKRLILVLISYTFLVQKFIVPYGRVWAGVFILIILSLVNNIEIKKMKLKEKVGIILILLNITIIQFLDIKSHYLSYFISYGNVINLSIFNIIFQNLK